jgi:outer membrane protein assembly factor BamB
MYFWFVLCLLMIGERARAQENGPAEPGKSASPIKQTAPPQSANPGSAQQIAIQNAAAQQEANQAQVAGHPATEPAPRIAPPQPFTTNGGKRKGWKVTIPGNHALATPAVVDGKLFIGGGFGSHEFYCFDAVSGKMLWQYRTADDGPTAAVVDGGFVAFNTESCELEVLTVDGKPVWKKWLGDPLMSMPAVASGRLLMAFPDSRGDHQHHLACFDLKTGKELWRKQLAGEIITAPVIDDEQVFLATLEGSLYCFRAKDGSPAWTEKEKNVTSAPTLWSGRCWFSRREEKSSLKAGKKVAQQMEQVAARATTTSGPIHDLPATQRVADYLDYGKRAGFGGTMGGMGMGGMGAAPAPASPKEGASQSADKGVGFDGGGIGVDEPPPGTPASPQSQPSAAPQISGKGDSKISQAAKNLGQGTVNGVWSYQGSKPFFYRDRLYAAMGDTLVCVDPRSEKVLWKKRFSTPGEKKKAAPKDEELLDATISPPAIANGKVFLGTGYGEIACVSADTGESLWQTSVGPSESIAFQPAVSGGRVYVSTESGKLYCLDTGDEKDEGWLMWGANAAHNGMAQGRRLPQH